MARLAISPADNSDFPSTQHYDNPEYLPFCPTCFSTFSENPQYNHQSSIQRLQFPLYDQYNFPFLQQTCETSVGRDDRTASQPHPRENVIFARLEEATNQFTAPLQYQLQTPRTDPENLHLYAEILGQFTEPLETFAPEEPHTQTSEFSSIPPEFMVSSSNSVEIISPSNTHFLPESISQNVESSPRYQVGQAEGSWKSSQPVIPLTFTVANDFVQSEGGHRSAVDANSTISESNPFEANRRFTGSSNIFTRHNTYSCFENFYFGNSQFNFDTNGKLPLTRVSASITQDLPTTVNGMQENELFTTAPTLLSTSCMDSRQPRRGNNIHGRKGMPKCELCRRHHGKVIRSQGLLLI